MPLPLPLPLPPRGDDPAMEASSMWYGNSWIPVCKPIEVVKATPVLCLPAC